MTAETTVHLLRHGEVHNPDGVLYGRLPGFGLSAAGQQMAVAAADALRDRDVAVVVSSPLERAQQTAAPLAEMLGLSVRLDDRLVESENYFEGRAVAVGVATLFRPTLWRYLYNPFRPSWGEPYRAVAERVHAAVLTVKEAADGREAVCVSHQLPIWVTRRYVEGRRLWHRPDRRQCGLASITSLTWQGDRLARVTYAEPAGPAARKPVPPGA